MRDKRQSNLVKHCIDFRDALRVFDGPVFEIKDHRRGEDRIVAIGLLEDIEIVVIYVMRGQAASDYFSKEGTSR